ncbi:flavin reductase family protein [Micromonospora sp. NPDC023633]|uniref:flavin reductase family protein n=1 Tax=Micromonospora sp. NPDC023633 TaxID=3154320 RepID=UPI0033CD91EB
MEINPTQLSEQQVYSFMCSAIVPRPISWISTVDARGVTNLAPFSYFMGVCCKPMTVLFCPVFGSEERPKKDTLLNIEQVPEFVINVTQEKTVVAANLSGAPVPHGESEFDLVGVTPEPSTRVRPPRVREANLALECRVQDIIEVNSGPGGGWVVLGTVLAIHAQDGIFDPQTMRVDLGQLQPVARLGGADFLRATDVFPLHRYRTEDDAAALVGKEG